MNILAEYTLTSARRNKRASLAILAAVLVVATMMSALCGFLYNVYADNLRLTLEETGDWHGELYANTPASALQTITGFDQVEAVMLKGPWQVAAIDDPRRAYLIYRNANADYWASMPEKNALLEGRIPQAHGEIAISKQYFEHHPEVHIGDTVTLPVGLRQDGDGAAIKATDRWHDGERFAETASVTLRITGKLDVATSSVVPAYTALGYLNEAALAPADDLTVYLRFHNIRDTYDLLPQIAQAAGYTPDEYGQYDLRYNTDYLWRLLVFSPQQKQSLSHLERLGMPLSFLAIAFLTVMVLVLIIRNAFALSANARLQQLGILASIGATPREIKRTVLLEALGLTLIALLPGLAIGQGLVKLFIDYANQSAEAIGISPVVFSIGLPSLAPAILLTLLTVWWSALLPARKIAKLTPIAAIRQQHGQKPFRLRLRRLSERLGIEGELAANALLTNAASYRTAICALTLSFLVLFGVLAALSASQANEAVYQPRAFLAAERDITLSLYAARQPDDRAIMAQIDALPQLRQSLWYETLYAAAWLAPDDLSQPFQEAGGFETAGRLVNTSYLLERDGLIRAPVVLIGLDDASFCDYAVANGVDADAVLQAQTPTGILLNTIEEVAASTQRQPVLIPYLAKASGDSLALTEKRTDDTPGDYTFAVHIAGTADEYPPIANRSLTGRYGLVLVLPMTQVDAITAHFVRGGLDQVTGVFLANEEAAIKPLREQIDTLCSSWFGSGDYELVDAIDYAQNKRDSETMMGIMTSFVIALLAIIGLSSAWAAVLGSLASRRQEFAILRSVGMAPKAIAKMLLLEGLLLGLWPLLLALPLCALALAGLLSLNEITLAQWLAHAPLLPLAAYPLAVLLLVILAYRLGMKSLLNQNIVTTLKNDLL